MQEARIKQVRLVCVWENTLSKLRLELRPGRWREPRAEKAQAWGPGCSPPTPSLPVPPPEASHQVPW